MPSLDLYVLDHCFQPIVDRCARWASCFRLARLCYIIAASAQAVTAGNMTVPGMSPMVGWGLGGVILLGAGFCLLINLSNVRLYELLTRPGRLNPARSHFRMGRLFWVLLALLGVTALGVEFGHSGHLSLSDAWNVVCWIGWLTGSYFMSSTPCPPPPPKPVRMSPFAVPQGA